jgi:hypothetical protein
LGERDQNDECSVTRLFSSLSPVAGERVAVRAETLASSGEARAEKMRGHAERDPFMNGAG